MNLGSNRMVENTLDRMFNILLTKLKGKSSLKKMKKHLNIMCPVYKYTLLRRILSEKENLPQDIILRCLPVFLDENTKFFSFYQYTDQPQIIKKMLKIISTCCPDIDMVDLRQLNITPMNKENFKTFLQDTRSLKSLRVKCQLSNCAIYKLLLEEDFSLHDQEVKDGLLKIEYIDGLFLSPSDCAKLLDILPNLKSLGMGQNFAPVITSYGDDENIAKKLDNISEFRDNATSLTSLESIVKLCPKTEKIYLFNPEENVVKNLWKFPLLTKIQLSSWYPSIVSELYYLLGIIGYQIKILDLDFPDEGELDPEIVQDLCPELRKLHINNET